MRRLYAVNYCTIINCSYSTASNSAFFIKPYLICIFIEVIEVRGLLIRYLYRYARYLLIAVPVSIISTLEVREKFRRKRVPKFLNWFISQ